MLIFLDKILTTFIMMITFYAVFFVGKFVHSLIHRQYDLNHQLVEEDNPALALAITGYYFGLVIALGGTLVGPSSGIVNDTLDIIIYGFVSIVLLNISWLVCDRLILRDFRVADELIRDRNQGTGAVSFGISVASGLVIFGAVSGEGGSIWTACVFWLIGQSLLILTTYVYEFITPYNVRKEIEKDNVAAGVSFAGSLIGMGIIIGLSAEGDFHSWSGDLPRFIGVSCFGLILLPIIRFLTDKVLFPTASLTDEIANQEIPNVGASYIEAFSYIGAAFVVYWCL